MYIPVELIIVAHMSIVWFVFQAYESTSVRKRRRKRK